MARLVLVLLYVQRKHTLLSLTVTLLDIGPKITVCNVLNKNVNCGKTAEIPIHVSESDGSQDVV